MPASRWRSKRCRVEAGPEHDVAQALGPTDRAHAQPVQGSDLVRSQSIEALVERRQDLLALPQGLAAGLSVSVARAQFECIRSGKRLWHRLAQWRSKRLGNGIGHRTGIAEGPGLDWIVDADLVGGNDWALRLAGEKRELGLTLLQHGLTLREIGDARGDALTRRQMLHRRPVELKPEGSDPLLVPVLEGGLLGHEPGQHLVVEHQVPRGAPGPERGDRQPTSQSRHEAPPGFRQAQPSGDR